MPAIEEQSSHLHALHDAYVWRVNAAIAAGRPDLARELADEYTDDALYLLAAGSGNDAAGSHSATGNDAAVGNDAVGSHSGTGNDDNAAGNGADIATTLAVAPAERTAPRPRNGWWHRLLGHR